MEEPPVTIFVMGENRWRAENEWPIARTHYTRYYLHAEAPGQHPPRRRDAVHRSSGR